MYQKTTMPKGILAVVSAVIALAAVSCGRSAGTTEPSPKFTSYIKAYTGGVVNESSTIKVEFTSAVPGISSGDNAGGGMFTFSPSLKGTARWTSPYMLEFIPEEGALRPGTAYRAVLRTDRILKTGDSELKNFTFSFMAAPKEAAISNGSMTIRHGSSGYADAEFTVSFSEDTAQEDITKMLSVEYGGRRADFELYDDGGRRKYTVAVPGLKRGQEDTPVTVVLDGSGSGYGKLKESAVIPALGRFRVVDHYRKDGTDPYIAVIFSEPLMHGLDMKGMAELHGVSRYYIEAENNILKISFNGNRDREMQLDLDGGITGSNGEKLGQGSRLVFRQDDLMPAVRIISNGTILPDSRQLNLAFQSVNLCAVDLEVIRVFENNILMFLQDNTLSTSDNLRRSGRLVYKRNIRLDTEPGKDLHRWQDFSIDLSGLFRQEPGAIYRVCLSFRQEYSLYGKELSGIGQEPSMVSTVSGEVTAEEEAEWDITNPYYYGSRRDWSVYRWRDRNNPMTPSYYMNEDRMPVCNLLASDIGIIAKMSSSDRMYLTVNSIVTTEPIPEAEVKIYNYQLQTIGEGRTDKDGMAVIGFSGKPFIVTAKASGGTGYLKVNDGAEKSMSRFDTGGEAIKGGIRGFVYGERGVWRPGDTLHVTLIVDDREHVLPDSHPVTMEIYTPQGQFHDRQVSTSGQNGFYAFHIPTSAGDPTGSWNAYFKVGGTTFHKSLPVETIKPNRLKINLDIKGDMLEAGKEISGSLAANWLTGPAASGLKATVEMSLSAVSTAFRQYPGYTFRNPVSQFTSSTTGFISTTLGNDGTKQFKAKVPAADGAPGMLKANLICRVEEKGGDESITTVPMPFSPFSSYVGIELPDTGKDNIETDTDNSFKVIVVDKDGTPVSGHSLEYSIFKLKWSWWWESRSESLDSYVNGTSASPVASGRITSRTTGTAIPFRVDYPEWGRYLIYVKDTQSGHATGGIVYVDWPSWRGRSAKSDPDGLTMLAFTLDKDSYTAGEEATVYIPVAEGGRALVSLENGRSVISRTWVTTGKEDTKYRFRVTEDMAPNFYVHISLLQPHSHTANDLPIRMYGVQPVKVSSPASHLHPQLSMPDVLRPQEEFSFTVSEKEGKPMTYTLAIVDEGLLDLTSFRTPDPWSAMYSREALGVRTWDLYDDVIGAFSGRFSPLFSIGGDENIMDSSKKDNRFNPVVRYLGPFTLEKGRRTHKVTLPMYVGSVRVMAVAGKDGAYGNSEKAVPVRSPLMILPTLPRVLGTGEEFSMPVNVFVMEEGTEDVKVSVSTEGPVRLTSSSSTGLKFPGTGDRIVQFSLAATDVEGTAKVTVTAEGGGHRVTETVSISVRNPNPVMLDTYREMIGPGEARTFTYPSIDGSQVEEAALSIASFPAIDFNGIYMFSSDYEHLCTEQIASRGLTLTAVKDMLSEENRNRADVLIPELLKLLYSRQLPDGGFAYWPGRASADEWVSSMAGHFMMEAEMKGYTVSKEVMTGWKRFQKRCVRNWRNTGKYDLNDLEQAYRLYTLALASDADAGAMNRLKETPGLSAQARWRLAAAYCITGKKAIAEEMTDRLQPTVPEYSGYRRTFGSSTRDIAMIIETLVLEGRTAKAMETAVSFSERFSQMEYTTQTVAFASVAMARLAEKTNNAATEAEVSENGNTRMLKSAKNVCETSLAPEAGSVTVTNRSEGAVYVALTAKSRPPYSADVDAASSGLGISVTYRGMDGEVISPERIAQGTEFIAETTVHNTDPARNLSSLALTQMIPSGWEIFNGRLFTPEDEDSGYDYQDIRDDRVCYYFSLPAGKQVTFRTRMRAVYQGTFVLPSVSCEDMYSPAVSCRTASGKTTVTAEGAGN